MKLYILFFVGFLTIASLSSCMNEEFRTIEERSGKGRITLDVSLLQPQATRANFEKVTDYPVAIFDNNGNEVKNYNKVSDFPANGEVLPVGNYSVVSHTPIELKKKMATPYFKGTEPMEIKKNIETEVDVVCKMLNSKIEINYSEDFLKLFSTWTITIDDGSEANANPETALAFTNADGSTPAAVYWLFEGNVTQLTVNFRATRKGDGSIVTDRTVLDKSQAAQQYVNDNPSFCGGDVLKINFCPTEATTGTVTGVTITATVSFDSNTTEKVETLDITDKSLNPDEGGNDPGSDEDLPYFDCPELETGVTYSVEDEEYPNTLVKIFTPKGMKSLKVSIEGGNDGFGAACGDLGFTNYELVGDTKLPQTFAALGVDDAEMPQGNETEYTFPVGAFYTFMNIYGATDQGKAHVFKMVVTDNVGNSKEAVLRVTITE